MTKKNSLTAKESETFELTIDSLSYNGGRGVGRYDGVVVFVPGTAPGDRVRVRVTERKPRFLEAELLEILEPSPHRRTPPCPVANRCGGCSWQHVNYDEQVRQKEKILRDSLRRVQPAEWLAFLKAPEEFHYRNRIQLQIQNGKRGFFSKRSRDLVEVEKCWIAEPGLNEKIRSLTAQETGDARKVEIALTEAGDVTATAGERDPHAALFSQVNRAQNKVLQERVLELSRPGAEWVMDLYAGSGNLTLPLAARFPDAHVTGVELSRVSVERARAKDSRIEWHAGDVAAVLKRFKPPAGAGLIVVDPPRTGCESEVIQQLMRLRPRQIVYVSCNPSTFARDAERLSSHYQLEKVQGLDMFPQTEHVELIASFRAT